MEYTWVYYLFFNLFSSYFFIVKMQDRLREVDCLYFWIIKYTMKTVVDGIRDQYPSIVICSSVLCILMLVGMFRSVNIILCSVIECLVLLNSFSANRCVVWYVWCLEYCEFCLVYCEDVMLCSVCKLLKLLMFVA